MYTIGKAIGAFVTLKPFLNKSRILFVVRWT